MRYLPRQRDLQISYGTSLTYPRQRLITPGREPGHQICYLGETNLLVVELIDALVPVTPTNNLTNNEQLIIVSIVLLYSLFFTQTFFFFLFFFSLGVVFVSFDSA